MSLLVAESQRRAYERNGRNAWINVPKIDGGKVEHVVEKHGIKAHFIQFPKAFSKSLNNYNDLSKLTKQYCVKIPFGLSYANMNHMGKFWAGGLHDFGYDDSDMSIQSPDRGLLETSILLSYGRRFDPNDIQAIFYKFGRRNWMPAIRAIKITSHADVNKINHDPYTCLVGYFHDDEDSKILDMFLGENLIGELLLTYWDVSRWEHDRRLREIVSKK